MCLKPIKTVLAGFTRDIKVKPLGIVEYLCKTRKGDQAHKVTFYVVKEADTPLLGRRTSEYLGLISLVRAVVTGPELTWSMLREKYAHNFDNQLGDLGEPYHIELDPNVPG